MPFKHSMGCNCCTSITCTVCQTTGDDLPALDSVNITLSRIDQAATSLASSSACDECDQFNTTYPNVPRVQITSSSGGLCQHIFETTDIPQVCAVQKLRLVLEWNTCGSGLGEATVTLVHPDRSVSWDKERFFTEWNCSNLDHTLTWTSGNQAPLGCEHLGFSSSDFSIARIYV